MASLNLQFAPAGLDSVLILIFILHFVLSGKARDGNADGEMQIAIKIKRKN